MVTAPQGSCGRGGTNPDAAIATKLCERIIDLLEQQSINPSDDLLRTWSSVDDPDDASRSFVAAIAYETSNSSFDFADVEAGFTKTSENHEVHALALTGGYIKPFAAAHDGPLLAALANYHRPMRYVSG